MEKIVILGNSGSGKSTLAAKLARASGLAHLDLDTLAWAPTEPPRRRAPEESRAAMDDFFARQSAWVVEGCYADLLEYAAARCTRLVFLNPGIEACLENCRRRPWEPHKYSSPEAQDKNLEFLLSWVREYDTRTDEFSLAAHRRLFDGFTGDKREYRERPELSEK